MQRPGHLGRRRGPDGPWEATGQPDAAAEDETSPPGTLNVPHGLSPRRTSESPFWRQPHYLTLSRLAPQQMIAVGGSIGTGLFVGSGGALSQGGPGALLIDFLLIGFMVLMTCQAIGEMSILYPVSGGFYALAVRMLDPAWGFA